MTLVRIFLYIFFKKIVDINAMRDVPTLLISIQKTLDRC